MVKQYAHILFATDLSPDNLVVAERAKELAQRYGAKLSLLHVVEPMPIYFGDEFALPATQEVEQQFMARAKKKMEGELAPRLGVATGDCHVHLGVTRMEILHFIEKHGVDLLVIGRHSRHGLGRLLGSTASAVLNTATCDVLAVRLG
ncbi:MAG: universal stress protein [Gammaproteobacteria bacterium]|nr:universal stress protein [Gammaproteobacteria bacterium]